MPRLGGKTAYRQQFFPAFAESAWMTDALSFSRTAMKGWILQKEAASSYSEELGSEQTYIDYAYERLEAMKAAAVKLRDSVIGESSGGTFQARYQRDVVVQTALERLDQLEIGAESLCFGRIDNTSDETFYIGRRAVYAEDQEPVVIDWRVPAAEPFYRATGMHPMDLSRRRHFSTEGRRLVAFEDEYFGDQLGQELGLTGPGALLGALKRERTGFMRDIVATLQREQDEIIRSPLEGVLAVQGGPGTGKTAVALHRAAYLLFTYRRDLTRQGVLIVGPNRLFLRYIDRVLPALGETGVILTTPVGLVSGMQIKYQDPPEVSRLKGDVRMAAVIAKAMSSWQKPIQKDWTAEFQDAELLLSARAAAGIVSSARRARGSHNLRHASVVRSVVRKLHSSYNTAIRNPRKGKPRPIPMTKSQFTKDLPSEVDLVALIDQMWPKLVPKDVVRYLLTDETILKRAAEGILEAQEIRSLITAGRSRNEDWGWSEHDVALIDEALTHTGQLEPVPSQTEDDDEEIHLTYGHIVVDEIQDLSPMQLRMLSRRSRFGSMTIVGDLAQATSPAAAGDWGHILEQLPRRYEAQQRELTINYRTPAEIMDLAAALLPEGYVGPRSVRSGGEAPRIIETSPEDMTIQAAREAAASGSGKVAIVVPAKVYDQAAASLRTEGITFGEAATDGLQFDITLVEVRSVKGLEFDTVVVLEPADVIEELGERALYVALTRATKTLVVVHSKPLPSKLRNGSLP